MTRPVRIGAPGASIAASLPLHGSVRGDGAFLEIGEML